MSDPRPAPAPAPGPARRRRVEDDPWYWPRTRGSLHTGFSISTPSDEEGNYVPDYPILDYNYETNTLYGILIDTYGYMNDINVNDIVTLTEAIDLPIFNNVRARVISKTPWQGDMWQLKIQFLSPISIVIGENDIFHTIGRLLPPPAQAPAPRAAQAPRPAPAPQPLLRGGKLDKRKTVKRRRINKSKTRKL